MENQGVQLNLGNLKVNVQVAFCPVRNKKYLMVLFPTSKYKNMVGYHINSMHEGY